MPGERDLDRITRWVRSAVCMAAVILAVGAGLVAVYRLTGQRIAEQGNIAKERLLEAVMPGAEIATETPYLAEDALSILAGYSGNELVGYCIEVEAQGFGGMMDMVVGVSTNGQVTGVLVTDHSEHREIGGWAMTAEYLDRYVGKTGTIRSESGNGVDALSGATDTCRAITEGVNKALYIASRLETGDVQYSDAEV